MEAKGNYSIFISVNDQDKFNIISIARGFSEFGFDLIGTEGTVIEFLNTDSYEYNNYDLYLCSMDDDEIPEEILDEDGEKVDVLKLENNGWSFERGEAEEEFDESEITEISISVDDKQFTFKSD